MIDYLRKLKADNLSGDERLRVDGVLSLLTELAKKYNTPVLVISELARDSYKFGQRLSMASVSRNPGRLNMKHPGWGFWQLSRKLTAATP